jgi:hypothetical protein
LSLHKSGLILYQHLSYFSNHKHLRSVFYRPICDLSCYIFCQVISRWPFECPHVHTMFLCSSVSLDVLLFEWIGTVDDWFTPRDDVLIFNKSSVILSEILLLNLPRHRGEYVVSTSYRPRPIPSLLSAVHRKKR